MRDVGAMDQMARTLEPLRLRDHFVFSARNQGRHATPRVTQKDMDEARVETWWGDPIVVRPDQLVKR